jgi:predicted metal-binding membrane protein
MPFMISVSDHASRVLVVAALAVLTTLAWNWLLPMHMAPMALLGAGPPAAYQAWTADTAWFMFAMWSVMMAGMMIPTAVPMVLTLERMARNRRDRQPLAAATVFILAYVAIWTGFSASVTAGQWAVERAGLMSGMMASASAWLSGLLLIGAGLFQFSPLKHACLARCRSPMGFLLTEWRPGLRGVFITGLRHGLYCLGCCWALMALLFVFGTMNLIAAAGLAGLVLAEKALPGGALVARVAGVAFAGWGLWILVHPWM